MELLDDQRLPYQASSTSEGQVITSAWGGAPGQIQGLSEEASVCICCFFHWCRLMGTSSAEEQISRAISGCSFSE